VCLVFAAGYAMRGINAVFIKRHTTAAGLG
jgi:hypothetical protein